MSVQLQHKRYLVHRRVVGRIAETIGTITAFVLIFSVLITLSNWPAYSRIIQDVIDPNAMANLLIEDEAWDEETLVQNILEQRLEKETHPEFSVGASNLQSFTPDDMGMLYPHEMRLEVPKVFEGTVPIENVELETFNFADLYESENKIQETLREGVVHYPFTASPNEFGNVFITGHSSYTPWDEGRYKEIFALLHKLEIGDEYYIYYQGKKYTYKVNDSFEIQPDDISVLNQPEDKKVSTLMTCTPVGTTLRRLIVTADLVSVE